MKRFIPLLLCLSLTLPGLLTACSGTGADHTAESGTADGTVTASPASEAPTDAPAEPVTSPVTEPETQPAAQPETTPVTEPETSPGTEPETQAPGETEIVTEPETVPEPETDAETEEETQPETEPETEPTARTLGDAMQSLIALPGLTLEMDGKLEMVLKVFGMDFATDVPFGSVTALTPDGFLVSSTLPFSEPVSTVAVDGTLYAAREDRKIRCDLSGTDLPEGSRPDALLQSLRDRAAEEGWGSDHLLPETAGEPIDLPLTEAAGWMAALLRTMGDAASAGDDQSVDRLLTLLDILASCEDNRVTLTADLSDPDAPRLSMDVRVTVAMSDLPESVSEKLGAAGGIMSALPATVDVLVSASVIGGEKAARAHITVPADAETYEWVGPEELIAG